MKRCRSDGVTLKGHQGRITNRAKQVTALWGAKDLDHLSGSGHEGQFMLKLISTIASIFTWVK